MKKLLLLVGLVVFLTPSLANSKEVWKPFGIELGKKVPDNLNIISDTVYCSGTLPRWMNHLKTSEFKQLCYIIETNNKDFPTATVLTNKEEDITNYEIDDVLAVSVFEQGFEEYVCHQSVKDMRDYAINQFGFKSITLVDNKKNYQVVDPLTQIITESDRHSWWEGARKNLGIEVMCYAGESVAIDWGLTDVKLKGIDLNF